MGAADDHMRRIIVVGCGGSGKSTFAEKLGAKLGLPVIALDLHFWRPGWQAPPADEWRQCVATLAAAPAWIIDGNYSGTYDIRMPRADTLIWLDYPRHVCLRRMLWRTATGYGRTRSGLPEGCLDRFDLAFTRYVWDFQKKHRPTIVDGIKRFGAHLRVFRLISDRDGDELLATIGAA